MGAAEKCPELWCLQGLCQGVWVAGIIPLGTQKERGGHGGAGEINTIPSLYSWDQLRNQLGTHWECKTVH